jgi:plasmid stabilization system protein ParE
VKVSFSEDAIADIIRLREFLKPVAPDAARRAVEAIIEGCEAISTFPARGRLRDDGARQLVIPFGASAYLARYRIDEEFERVVILRVRHAREHES